MNISFLGKKIQCQCNEVFVETLVLVPALYWTILTPPLADVYPGSGQNTSHASLMGQCHPQKSSHLLPTGSCSPPTSRFTETDCLGYCWLPPLGLEKRYPRLRKWKLSPTTPAEGLWFILSKFLVIFLLHVLLDYVLYLMVEKGHRSFAISWSHFLLLFWSCLFLSFTDILLIEVFLFLKSWLLSNTASLSF